MGVRINKKEVRGVTRVPTGPNVGAGKRRVMGPSDGRSISLLAVDPGGAHVGVATWSYLRGARACEVDAEKALPFIKCAMQGRTAVIVEEFRLYPDKAMAQSRQQMSTSEMIGAIRWMAEETDTPVHMQPAGVKKPTEAQCRARRLDYRHDSGHATDAKLHLYYWMLKQGIMRGRPQ